MEPKELGEFLALARKRFEAAAEDEKDLREKFISDLRFASPDGEDQWDATIKAQRLASGRPVMAFPRCHTFVQQVSNEGRQNKPQIKFAPRLDGSKDTAEVFEGIARWIQYASDAQIAYETALEYSAGGSFGYFRFLTEYCDDDSDDLELKVIPVLDPLQVYGILVPACFGQKARSGFVVQDVPKEEYKARFPKSEVASLGWDLAAKEGAWVGSESVKIAEYWTLDETPVKGKRRPKSVVKFCLTNGIEILPNPDGSSSETVWPGSTIPIIPVLGKQMIVAGKPQLYSVVRPQKAAQQLINYSKTRIAETLSISPISPFIAVEGQIDASNKAQWESMNRTLTPVLTYKQVDIAGKPAPPPQRQTFEPPIASLSAFVAQEVDDMKATTGIFDASLGAKSNETSGHAILARQQQSNLSTMHFMDNLERAFKKGGEVMAEVIPIVYDTAREIQILGEDEAPKIVQINKKHKDEAGREKHYDLTSGKYDVVVTMGRAFNTKRMESWDLYQQLVQSQPNLLPIFGDVMFQNSDTAGADIVAARFHKMLPPNLHDDKDNALPPQAQAAIAQAQQQTQLMQQELAKLTMEKHAKVLEHQGKLQEIQAKSQADMALEKLKLENSLAIAEVSTKAQILSEREGMVRDLEAQFHEQAHDAGMQAQQHAQAQQMAQQQHQQGLEAIDAQAANQSAQSAQDAAQQATEPSGTTA